MGTHAFFDRSVAATRRAAHAKGYGRILLAAAVVSIGAACSSPTGDPAIRVDPQHAEDLLVVDCLLPGRVRQLGSQLSYLEAPRPAKTSAAECEIRGGEYTSWDRANFATSLRIWLPKAKEGDPQAQNYVGEIFEKGLGVAPDYAAALVWYTKAAEQHYSPAQINLGQLYERGLGVEADIVTAMNWYRRASGLEELHIAYVPSAEAIAELEGLRGALSQQTQAAAQLQEKLDAHERDLTASRQRREMRRREGEREKRALETARQELQLTDARNRADQARIDTEAAQLEADRRTFEQEISATSTSEEIIAAGQSQLQRAGALLSSLYTAMTTREAALDEHQREIEQRRAQQSEVESERLALAQAREGLDTERKQLEQDRLALQGEAATLERNRAQLAKRSDRASSTGQKLAAARAQLERASALATLQAAAQRSRSARLERRERDIRSKEVALARGEREVERLDRQVAQLKAEAARQRTEVVMLAQNNRVNLPGPSIQIVDPLIPLTRGLTVTMAIPAASTRLLVGRVEAPAGLVSLTLNDREIATDKRGLFRSEVTLRDGDTPVSLVAIDREGKRGAREFVLRPSDKLRGRTRPRLAKKPAVAFGDYYALVIGNDQYRNLPRLDTAISDATAVGAVLAERYGFAVTTLTNATRYEILSALNTLRGRLSEKDNLLIYYAGHGELDKLNMRGHWLPVDAEQTSSANWISNIALTDILNTMNARHVMVVADSCYSGALTRSSLARLEAGLTSEAREAWQRAMVQKRSRTALTSGGLAPVLDAGGGEHSIFAKALIDILEANTGILEGQRLFQELSAQVTWAAEAKNFEQIPQYAPIKFAGHESGEFFFVPDR